MSRSSNINLIVCDNRVELLLGFTEPGNVVKDNFSFFESLCSVCDSGFDRVNHGEGGIPVIDDL